MASSNQKFYEMPSKFNQNFPSNSSGVPTTTTATITTMCNKTPSRMTFEDLLLDDDDDEDKTRLYYSKERKCIAKAGENDSNSSWQPVPGAVLTNISVEYKPEPVKHSIGITHPLNINYSQLINHSQHDHLQFDHPKLEKPPRKRMKLDHLSKEERIFRRKLKNRIAAQNARNRQNVKVYNLKAKLEEAQSQIKNLTKLAAVLAEPEKLEPAAYHNTNEATPISIASSQIIASSKIKASSEITDSTKITASLQITDSTEIKASSEITASSKITESTAITEPSNITDFKDIAPCLVIEEKPQEAIKTTPVGTPHSQSVVCTTVTTQEASVKHKSTLKSSTVVNQPSPRIFIQPLSHNTSIGPASISFKKKTETTFPKPACSFSNLIFLAIKNSPTGYISVSQIYSFLCEYFPYFRTAPKGWKNSIRHNLSFSKLKFEKVGKIDIVGKQRIAGRCPRGCMYRLNPLMIEKMNQDYQKWSKKNELGIKYAMKYPELLESLERGEMKFDPCWLSRNEEDDEVVDPLAVDSNKVTIPIAELAKDQSSDKNQVHIPAQSRLLFRNPSGVFQTISSEKCECGKQCQQVECGGQENGVEDLLSYIASPDDAKDDPAPLPVIAQRLADQTSQISVPFSLTVQKSSTMGHRTPDGSSKSKSSTTLPENPTGTISDLSLYDTVSLTSRDMTSNAQIEIGNNDQVPPLIPASTLSDYNNTTIMPIKNISELDISKIVKKNTSKSSYNVSLMSGALPLDISTHTSKTLAPRIFPLQPLKINNLELLKKISQTRTQMKNPVSKNISLPNKRVVYMKLKDSNKVVPVTVKINQNKVYLSKNDTSGKNNEGNNEHEKVKSKASSILNISPLTHLNISKQSNHKTPSDIGNLKKPITANENSENPFLKKDDVKDKSIASLFPSSFMVYNNMKSTNHLEKGTSHSETHFTKNIACEDCGRVWYAVFVNIAVNLLCPDLEVFGCNGEFKEKQEKASAIQSWVMSMFIPKEDDTEHMGLTYLSLKRSVLTCVTPQVHTGYVWRVNHSGKGKAAGSGCRIIPNVIRTSTISAGKEQPEYISNIPLNKHKNKECSNITNVDIIDLEPQDSKTIDKLDKTITKNEPLIKSPVKMFDIAKNMPIVFKSALATPKTIIIPVSKFKNPVRHNKIPEILSIKANNEITNIDSQCSILGNDNISPPVVAAKKSTGADIFNLSACMDIAKKSKNSKTDKESNGSTAVEQQTSTKVFKQCNNSMTLKNTKQIGSSKKNHAEIDERTISTEITKNCFNSDITKYLRIIENTQHVSSAENIKKNIVEQNTQNINCEYDKQSFSVEVCEQSTSDQPAKQNSSCEYNNLNENNEVSKKSTNAQQKSDISTFNENVDFDFTIKDEIFSPIKDGHNATFNIHDDCDLFDNDIIIKEEFIVNDDLERLLCDEITQEYITDSFINESHNTILKEEKMELERKVKLEPEMIESKRRTEICFDGRVDRSDIVYKSNDKKGLESSHKYKEIFEMVMPNRLENQTSIIKKEDSQNKRKGQKLNTVILEEKISKEEISDFNKVNAIELGSMAAVQKGLYNTRMKSINDPISAEISETCKGSNEIMCDESKFKENFIMLKDINKKNEENYEKEFDNKFNDSSKNLAIIDSAEPNIENEMVDVENINSDDKSEAPDDEIFQIEKILKDRKREGKREFLIKWLGYSSKHNSWEPKENFLGGKALLKTYYEKKKAELSHKLKRKAKEDPVWHKLQDADAVPPVTPRPRSKGRKRRKISQPDFKTNSSVLNFFETIPYVYKNCQAPSSDKFFKYIDSKYRDLECLYSIYNKWCMDNGFKGETETKFKEEYSKLGLRIHKDKCVICEIEKERHKRSYSSFFVDNPIMEEDNFTPVEPKN